MHNRTILLESIRPLIHIVNEKSEKLEQFQSETLRPILKFQNDLLLSVFSFHLAENKIIFSPLTIEKKEVLIHSILKKELGTKNLMVGLIVGYFTETELLFYFFNKKEINKRIIELLIKRISDQKENVLPTLD